MLSALALGAAGAALGIAGPWGANATLLLAALAVSGAHGSRRARPGVGIERFAGYIGAAVFAVGFTITENTTLRLLDALAIATLLSLPLVRPACAEIGSIRPVALGLALLESALHAAVGALLLLHERCAPSRRPDPRTGRVALAPILAGSGIALVLALIFGSLLRASDAVFDDWVARRIDTEWLAERVATLVAVSILSAGLLHGWLARPLGDRSPFPAPDPVQLRAATVLIPLATLVALFGGFVAVQAGYLFPEVPAAAEQLSALARRGFFELVVVGGLALFVLLLADSCLRYAARGVRRTFVLFAGALLVLVAAILASAMARLGLYIDRYGWTEQRLFASVFLLWTALALPWFGVTALRGEPRRFTAGALLGALLLGVALHTVSPERVIVASHLDRPPAESSEPEREIDFAYLRTLGVGSIPAVAARWERIPAAERIALLANWEREAERERPTFAWTLARARAERALEQLPEGVEGE